MELTVHGPLRGITGSETVSLSEADGPEPQTVHTLLKRLVKQHPRADDQLFDNEGRLRGSVRVLVDGDRATPETPCPPTAEISVIPAAQGG